LLPPPPPPLAPHPFVSIFDIGNGTHYNKITILLFSSKILGVVTVGRIMARIVGGHVTTDSCITEIMYK
jgi:hypothetical protein